ncbi:MAG: tetratricopeptide repeat-containing sensor histidine kinase [Bacteroidales bacterium]|nr:tetratricopeptide repeat-containing sensor histidine kinase [Bacteroidales bacterium]
MSLSKTNFLAALLGLLSFFAGLHQASAIDNTTFNDSIHQQLQSLPDTLKIIHLLDLSNQYQQSNATASLEFAREALGIAISVNDPKQVGTINLKIAELYLLKGIYDKSMAFLLEALKQFQNSGLEKEEAFCYEVMGSLYNATDNPQQAIAFFNKAITINIEKKRVSDVARNYINLGSVFVGIDSIDKGLSYYLISLMIIDSLDLESEKRDLLIQLGDGYFKLGKYEESLKNYYQAMELAEKNGDLFMLANAKSRIGITYFRLNNMPAATKYSKESIMLTGDLKTFRIAGESYRNLADIYESQQNYKKALEYHIRYKKISDSLLNEEKLLHIGELQAKYDITQKEKENELLKQQNVQKSKKIKRFTIAAFIIINLFILTLIQLIMLVRLNGKTRYLNLKLAEQGKELEELNDQKDKFFSFVAHNLKNPFSTILGFSELLAKNSEEKLYEKIERYSRNIQGLSVHVNKILDNLLEWSRLQRRNFEYKPEKINITNLIRDVLEMNHKEAVRKEIELHYDLPENLAAYADKFMVASILQNLMSNALNFTPSSGKINISGKVCDPQVVISVEDTGIGIAPEDLPKLFRIDVHPAKIGTAESKGAGLGLVICKEMIHRCKGEITIDSKLARGTSVTFTLPVSNDNSKTEDYPDMQQPDFVLETKENIKSFGQLPEGFIDSCISSLMPKYNEVRTVLSVENLSGFARDVENAGRKYNISSFIHYGRYLAALIHLNKVDKILRILPEFKKIVDTFVV